MGGTAKGKKRALGLRNRSAVRFSKVVPINLSNSESRRDPIVETFCRMVSFFLTGGNGDAKVLKSYYFIWK